MFPNVNSRMQAQGRQSNSYLGMQPNSAAAGGPGYLSETRYDSDNAPPNNKFNIQKTFQTS